MNMVDDIVTGYITAALWADCSAMCTCGGRCPQCGEEVWDRAKGYKLPHCWNGEGHTSGDSIAFDEYSHTEECQCYFEETGGLDYLSVSDDDRAYIKRLVESFLYAVSDAQIDEYGANIPMPPCNAEFSFGELFGHDLRLSSGGHGAGFFDRSLGKLGDDLQDLARAFPCPDVWQVDDATARFDHVPLATEVS